MSLRMASPSLPSCRPSQGSYTRSCKSDAIRPREAARPGGREAPADSTALVDPERTLAAARTAAEAPYHTRR
jgi:hypothetical protein